MDGLAGEWVGSNKLWLDPTQPPQESETTATVVLLAQGKFATLRYTWAYQGRPQEGLIYFGPTTEQRPTDAAWADSWHMSDKLMSATGEVRDGGVISVLGSYAAPPGPDWGWRIEIRPAGPDAFRLLMFNIEPQMEEVPAVEAVYARRR